MPQRKSGCTGAIFPSSRHELKAWQTGGVWLTTITLAGRRQLSWPPAKIVDVGQASMYGRSGSRKTVSPPTRIRGTADVGRRPFAGSKSRKQPLDACRCQRPVDRRLLPTPNGRSLPNIAAGRLAEMVAAKLTLTTVPFIRIRGVPFRTEPAQRISAARERQGKPASG